MKNNSLEIPKLNFDANGSLVIVASETSSKHDFDFFQGKSIIQNRKLKKRFANCTEWIEFPSTQEMYKILNGIGNIDNFLATFNGEPFEGMTVRLFNPATKLWSIYWSDSTTGVLDQPVIGSFEDNVGHFFSEDTFEGRNVIQVFRWDARDKKKPIWSQAMSDDKGKTWEWNWFMFMTKTE
ncbi:hypothetical protein ACHRV5_11780 [Flavobacterium sp. FlaQc-52]|jgi:hypothetical protein|uniref:hypothetical protein n=1 Tax=Flavobacterium sp. FlaQc-52 TaxID=3374185 RepID=UPI0037582646